MEIFNCCSVPPEEPEPQTEDEREAALLPLAPAEPALEEKKNAAWFLLRQEKKGTRKLWLVRTLSEELWVVPRVENRRIFSLISDATKEIFGLRRLGFVRADYHKHYTNAQALEQDQAKGKPQKSLARILLRDPMATQGGTQLADLDEVEKQTVRREVQDVLAFRDVFGIVGTGERTIAVCPGGAVYSFGENQTVLERSMREDVGVLSLRLVDSWFNDGDAQAAFRRISGYRAGEEYPECCARIRRLVEKAIVGVDRDWVWLATAVYDRLMRRLSAPPRGSLPVC